MRVIHNSFERASSRAQVNPAKPPPMIITFFKCFGSFGSTLSLNRLANTADRDVRLGKMQRARVELSICSNFCLHKNRLLLFSGLPLENLQIHHKDRIQYGHEQ